MKTHKILLVEDSDEMIQLIKRSIKSDVLISVAKTVASAGKQLQSENPDLILLDVRLPDGDGFHFASLVRGIEIYDRVPILFMTAKEEPGVAVLALASGGDDFIRKPFDPIELDARVASFLRKSEKLSTSSKILTSGRLKIDIENRVVSKKTEDGWTEIHMAAICYRMLIMFMQNEGRELNRDEIKDRVWGPATYVFIRSVDSHLSKLRRALGDCSHYITSQHGSGYKYEPSDKLE